MASNPLGQHFIIKSAVITSDRTTGNDPIDNIEIGSLVAQLKITETASRPYTIGQVLIRDENNLFRALRIMGSERITFEIVAAKGNGVKPIKRTYIIRGINTVATNNTFVLDIMDEAGYIASAKAFAESYTGNLPTIISQISEGQLNRKVKAIYETDVYPYIKDTSTHINIPYMTPWQALTWLTDRTTTERGTPYFLSGSFYHNTSVMWSLESSLSSIPFNPEHAFVRSDRYTQATGQTGIDDTIYAETAIRDYVETHTDSMHALDRAHALAGTYDLVDTNSNLVEPQKYNLHSLVKKMSEDGIIKYQDVVDPSLNINDRFISNESSSYLMQARSSGTYLLGNSYQDESESHNRLNNKMIKNVMMQKTITATLPGKLFAAFNVTVGHKVRMHFESGDRVSNKRKLELDPKLSGDYVITGITHNFDDTEYNVVIDAVKFHRDPSERN